MKNYFYAFSLLLALNANASIDQADDDSQGKATAMEVATSRACFNEVAEQGCGEPGGGDDQHFYTCVAEVRETLTDNCKSRITELYGSK